MNVACSFSGNKSIGSSLLLVLGLLLVTASAQADTVVMKNKKTYTGKIKSVDDAVLVIRSEGIDWTLPLKDIASHEQNDEGTEDAAVLVPPTPPPPPPAASTAGTGKRGKHGKASKGGGLPLVILYSEENCQGCRTMVSTFVRNNSKLRYEERKITTASQKAELCQRAAAFKVKCESLPLVEYNGKIYDGANMIHLADGGFDNLTY